MQNDAPSRHEGAQPDNGNALRTGLYVKSPNLIGRRDRMVQRLVRKVEKFMPWLEPSDRPTVRAWSQLEILNDMVYEDLRRRGVLNGEGEARRLLDDYRKLRATQIILSRELGMTPAARATIKAGSTSAAIDLVALMSGQSETGESLESAPAEPADNPEPETK